MAKQDPRLKGLARHMRKKPTKGEARLWKLLQDRRFQGVKFRRQVPLGRYIADFACHDPKIVIELDGSGHERTVVYDLERKAWLEERGFTVLRFGSEIGISDGSELQEVVILTIQRLKKHPKDPIPDEGP
ncbi:MAG: endonuclease domain-containing protein [Fimbriimonas sp.]